MLWIFERQGERAIVEVIHVAPNRYALRYVDAEGVERFELFTNATDVAAHKMDLARALSALGWQCTDERTSEFIEIGTSTDETKEDVQRRDGESKDVPDTNRFVHLAREAVQEAERRALARGLIDVEIQLEAQDASSQYWVDVREVLEDLKRTHTH